MNLLINVVDAEKVRPLLIKLGTLLKDGDSEATELSSYIMDELVNTELSEKMVSIKRRIEDYDFEDAIETLSGMLKALKWL